MLKELKDTLILHFFPSSRCKRPVGRKWRWHGAISELLFDMSQTVSISLLSNPIILKFISLLTKPACPTVCFLEHRVHRMLIDVTWKKSFELNRFLYCWSSFSDSLVCDVNIQEGNMVCSVSDAYVSWMNLLSLSLSLPPYLSPSLPHSPPFSIKPSS